MDHIGSYLNITEGTGDIIQSYCYVPENSFIVAYIALITMQAEGKFTLNEKTSVRNDSKPFLGAYHSC